MDALTRLRVVLRQPAKVILVVVIIVSIFLAFLAYGLAAKGPHRASTNTVRTAVATPTPSPTPIPQATPTPTPVILPSQDISKILGIDVSIDTSADKEYPGIFWVRMGYPNCGNGNLQGQVLKDTLQYYHKKGVRVLMTICQNNSQNIDDTGPFNDVAQSHPDAVQCGNEEMKQDAAVSFLYSPPDRFAKFYDLCEHTIHSVDQNIPVVLGSLDPHVAGPDYQLMVNQVNYLNQMQAAMNSTVHPGGNWDWHNQSLGLIDSWHNGYMGSNNLAGIFNFWAQQFQIDPNSGQLGKHLWVVEGTGCFKGCGLYNNTQVAIAHILTVISDVQTAMQAQVPLFVFSGKDFIDQGVNWPIGVLDGGGNSKPLRQDLGMGARTLTLSCPDGSSPAVADQEQLLAKLYSHCSLPSNYAAILSN
ncbi:MAG TPA: hypothetical protein VHV10_07430 [Ktedonobacteraceae bacterium]|jgi:hypothetical protein|nr:hypothetical protein [Ktedonobacteraceae bacterium]